MGQVGAQIDQDDPKIGQDGPKIGQDGANFEDFFEFWIFCEILTNIEKNCVFSTLFARFAIPYITFEPSRTMKMAVRRRKRVIRVVWLWIGVVWVWESTSLTRWSQDDAR